MKLSRLVWTGLAVVVVAGTAAFAIACSGDHKTAGTKASAASASASSGCSAEMAAACTPEMAAACAAKGGKAAMAGCPAMGAKATTAVAAGHAGCETKSAATAVAAGHPGCETRSATTAAAANAACGTGAKGVKATAASADCCAPGAKGAKATTAAAAPAGRVDAVVAGASCGTHAKGAGTSAAHAGCDACSDMSACQSDIAEAGGHMQVVPLKNGLMYVYTAESSAKVRAVQAAVHRHAERMQAVGAAADKATLCASCKEMRGAAASGKLTREVVNIESGCLTLVTSGDPKLVSKLYALAGVGAGGARAAKS